MEDNCVIEMCHITKVFPGIIANDDITLGLRKGEIHALLGENGAGKSTLVRCLNFLERPDSGEVIVDNKILGTLSEKELLSFRKEVAMIFQGFNLLMQSTCLKNVMFPMELEKVDKNKARERALELLDMVGLKDKANAYPATLSGGQKQRIAIARALACNPKILLCDEATSALDPTTTNQILDLISDINKKLNITVVIITHQMSVVENVCNKVAILDNGSVVETGMVTDVFSHPKSLAAKKLVFPESDQSSVFIEENKQHAVRVIFNGGTSTGKPLLSRLAIEENIPCNILNASIRNINGCSYGSMLIGVDTKEEMDKVISYLNKIDGVSAMEFEL